MEGWRGKKGKGKTYSYFEQVKSVILEKETKSIRTEKRKLISNRRRGLHTDRERMGLVCRDDATGAQSTARGYKGL